MYRADISPFNKKESYTWGRQCIYFNGLASLPVSNRTYKTDRNDRMKVLNNLWRKQAKQALLPLFTYTFKKAIPVLYCFS